MVVVVKRGFVRAGRVLIDGVGIRVRRDIDTYLIPEFKSQSRAHVRYLDMRDRLLLSNSRADIEVKFGPNVGAFEFGGRTYTIGSMKGGDILVRERDRTVIEGRVTVSGVRLEKVAIELVPIQRELAFGLALRSEDLAREARMAPRTGPGF